MRFSKATICHFLKIYKLPNIKTNSESQLNSRQRVFIRSNQVENLLCFISKLGKLLIIIFCKMGWFSSWDRHVLQWQNKSAFESITLGCRPTRPLTCLYVTILALSMVCSSFGSNTVWLLSLLLPLFCSLPEELSQQNSSASRSLPWDQMTDEGSVSIRTFLLMEGKFLSAEDTLPYFLAHIACPSFS